MSKIFSINVSDLNKEQQKEFAKILKSSVEKFNEKLVSDKKEK